MTTSYVINKKEKGKIPIKDKNLKDNKKDNNITINLQNVDKLIKKKKLILKKEKEPKKYIIIKKKESKNNIIVNYYEHLAIFYHSIKDYNSEIKVLNKLISELGNKNIDSVKYKIRKKKILINIEKNKKEEEKKLKKVLKN